MPNELLKAIFEDHLYKNTLWLIISSVTVTGLGFFFWAINTRLFSSEQIGIASTLLSSSGLLVALSLLGLDIAFMRYLPNLKEKNEMINSCFSVAGITAFILGIIFVLNVHYFLPKLTFLRENVLFGFLFVIFVIFDLFSTLIGSVFIALGKSKFVFIRSLIFSLLKLVFPFVFVSLGGYGIFSSWMVSVIISFVIILFFFGHKLNFQIHKNIIKKILKFSVINYISNFLSLAPGVILPLMITHVLNPTITAYFYIDWMIASMLYIIPTAVSKSLLSDGSWSRNNFKNKVNKSIKFTYILLIPPVILTIALSKSLLLLFGAEYSSNAFRLLQIFALSGLPLAINIIYVTIQNVQHKIKAVLFTNFVIISSTLTFSYIFLSHGVILVGFSWLFTQVIVGAFVTYKLIKNG